jgi:hypothetical protein
MTGERFFFLSYKCIYTEGKPWALAGQEALQTGVLSLDQERLGEA